MVLQRGITGFFDDVEVEQQEQTDCKKFRSLCYNIALQQGVTLEHITECEYPFTYHKAMFTIDNEQVFLLVNAYYPTAACAKNDDPLHFCDVPEVFLELASHYTLLDEESVLAYPTKEQLNILDETELQQLQYWKPTNIGQIIFNHWD